MIITPSALSSKYLREKSSKTIVSARFRQIIIATKYLNSDTFYTLANWFANLNRDTFVSAACRMVS